MRTGVAPFGRVVLSHSYLTSGAKLFRSYGAGFAELDSTRSSQTEFSRTHCSASLQRQQFTGREAHLSTELPAFASFSADVLVCRPGNMRTKWELDFEARRRVWWRKQNT